MTFRELIEKEHHTVFVLDVKSVQGVEMFKEYIGYSLEVHASTPQKALGKFRALLAKQIIKTGKNVYKQYNEREIINFLKKYVQVSTSGV